MAQTITTPMLKLNRLVKTGTDIMNALAKPDQDDRPLVAELIYPGETTFITADPAIGKSTLATQIALCVTSGEPVFDLFEVSHPATVYYIALETRWTRQVALIRRMCQVLHPNLDNLYWDDPIGIDFTAKPLPNQPDDIDKLLALITHTVAKPGLVILDPLYLTVNQDLKDGTAANAVSRFLNKLTAATGCAALILHHTHRERYDIKGHKVEEDDNIYGSRWLQAHMALGWSVSKTNEGTRWKRTKDRFSLSRKEFFLEYDPVTKLSNGGRAERTSATSRLQHFLAAEPEGSQLTYEQLAARIGCHINYVKALMLNDQSLRVFAEPIQEPGKPTLWRVKPHGNGRLRVAPDFSVMDAAGTAKTEGNQ